ncbi:MAG: hypothetical protein K1X35_13175 [Caulobacteraceae bacterium]|nr:hypothetical protein [Caulobacteraceae bacterium]
MSLPRLMTLRRLLILVAVAAALPASTLAEPARTNSPTPELKKTCQKKHDTCVHYCIQSGKVGKDLNNCTEGCALNANRCFRGLPPA